MQTNSRAEMNVIPGGPLGPSGSIIRNFNVYLNNSGRSQDLLWDGLRIKVQVALGMGDGRHEHVQPS